MKTSRWSIIRSNKNGYSLIITALVPDSCDSETFKDVFAGIGATADEFEKRYSAEDNF